MLQIPVNKGIKLVVRREKYLEGIQAFIDKFYEENGPCCAGCDFWRWHNSLVGECIRTAPVSARERVSMLGWTQTSLKGEAGHIFTLRDHYCGEFKDEQ